MFYFYHDGIPYYPEALSKKLESVCPGGRAQNNFRMFIGQDDQPNTF